MVDWPEEPTKQEPPFYCPVCDRSYDTMEQMGEHVDRAHPEYMYKEKYD